MFSWYGEFWQLPYELRIKHGLKGKETIQLHCIKSAGYSQSMKLLTNEKGILKFYLQKTKGIIKASDERLAGYWLQGSIKGYKSAINVSSIFEYFNPEFNGFATGEPNNKKVLRNGELNPLIDFKNEGYLFIINSDFTKMELLIIDNGRFFLDGYKKQLAAGEFDEALQQMRVTAKPFFEY